MLRHKRFVADLHFLPREDIAVLVVFEVAQPIAEMLPEGQLNIRGKVIVDVSGSNSAELALGLRLKDNGDKLTRGCKAVGGPDISVTGGEAVAQEPFDVREQAVVVADGVLGEVVRVEDSFTVCLRNLGPHKLIQRHFLVQDVCRLKLAPAKAILVHVRIGVLDVRAGHHVLDPPVQIAALFALSGALGAVQDVRFADLVELMFHEHLLDPILNFLDVDSSVPFLGNCRRDFHGRARIIFPGCAHRQRNCVADLFPAEHFRSAVPLDYFVVHIMSSLFMPPPRPEQYRPL